MIITQFSRREVYIMYEDFVREIDLIEKSEEELNIELIKSIIKTKTDLENANKNYEFAEGELIDYYTYQIKANQSKLDYLIKSAKNKGLVLDMINELKIRLYEENNKVI